MSKICPKCNKEYEAGKFCPECGSALIEKEAEQTKECICPQCGTVNPEGSLFCQECGAKLDIVTPKVSVKNPEDELLDKANKNFKLGRYKLSLPIYEDLATKGNVCAQANYGWSLLNAWGVKRNVKKGVSYLETAAQQGNCAACCWLVDYFAGEECTGKSLKEIDYVNAQKYFNLAQKYKADEKKLEELKTLITPNAKITQLKVNKDITNLGEPGIEVTCQLDINGLKGKKVNVTVYKICEFDDIKKILSKPEEGEYTGYPCLYREFLFPVYPLSTIPQYKFTINYEKILNIQTQFDETLYIQIWDVSNSKPTLLDQVEIPYTIKCVTHMFKSNEWVFNVR